MISPLNDAAVEVGALLLAAPDAASRASIIASSVLGQFPNSACAIHRFIHENVENAWTVIGLAGDISPDPESVGSGNRLMAPLVLDTPEPLIYTSADILREDYSHLRISRSVSSIALVPLLQDDELVGAIEILFFSGTPRLQDLESIAPIVQLASPAILAAENNEAQRQDLLDSVHRMTQLYDLEKSLNATLEIDEVTALDRRRRPPPCWVARPSISWLFEGDVSAAHFYQRNRFHGRDRHDTSPGDGYVADMAEEGEPLLIADADDERLLRPQFRSWRSAGQSRPLQRADRPAYAGRRRSGCA